uniref:Peroxisomal membrane protein PEX14-like KPWE domain-containing protein n=1 Tax=Poecilia reticulata TaxID=8081 RepID=A0A3P9MYH2_POERE
MRFPHLLRSPPSSPPASLSQLSFAEVMQLVQEGKEVPGVTEPDVQPSNQSPTPSQMQRVQKPWEGWHLV